MNANNPNALAKQGFLMRSFVLTAVAASIILASASAPPKIPQFGDYPVHAIYTGKLASPRLLKPQERRYRTAIRTGVEKGYGVMDNASGFERPGPNFAGKFIVVAWGCGTECYQYAIVDAISGRIFQPPARGPRIAYFSSGYLTFRIDSRLMIASTSCVMGDPERCDRDYFVWKNARFTRIYSIVAKTGHSPALQYIGK